jgi:hypothetical protein
MFDILVYWIAPGCTLLHLNTLNFAIGFGFLIACDYRARAVVGSSGAALLVGVVARWLAVLPLGAVYCLRSLVGVLLAALPLHWVMQARQTL